MVTRVALSSGDYPARPVRIMPWLVAQHGLGSACSASKPLSFFPSRVLKEGGSLVVMVGQYHLPQILSDLTTHLRYHWRFITMMTQCRTLVHNRMIFAAYEPILSLCKGA